jgi:hypothetical protein
MLENTEGTINKWTFQRNWQQDEGKQNKTKTQHNMCCTPLCTNKHK